MNEFLVHFKSFLVSITYHIYVLHYSWYVYECQIDAKDIYYIKHDSKKLLVIKRYI